MINIAYLYWLHLDCHTNPYTQGYVGFTENLHARFRAHNSELRRLKHSNKILQEAYICSVGYMYRSVLYKGSKQDCLALEYKLRPSDNIGWNIHRGGGGRIHDNIDRELYILEKAKM